MRTIKKTIAVLAAAALLAGCSVMPAVSSGSVEEIAAPAAQTLNACADPALAPALQAYCAAQDVELKNGDRTAALLLTDYKPDDVDALPMRSDTLLQAAADRAGLADADSLPMGSCLYGYWANKAALTALLGENAVTALQNASWAEWSDFVETLSAWLAAPKAVKVTLSGTDYTLPAQCPADVRAAAVFAPPTDVAAGYTAALLAADGKYTADALTGPVNGVYSAVTLEADHMAADGENAVFCRGKLTDLLAAYGSDACEGLALIPFKCELEESDLSTEEYNLTGLLNYPVLARTGWITLNADADEAAQKAAKSAALWLYTGSSGEAALTETLGLITPWNTASDKTEMGALQVKQVGTGILPATAVNEGTAAALAENEAALRGTKHTAAQRKAFTARVVEIFAAYGEAQPQ